MQFFHDFSDERNKTWCYHCTVTLGVNSTNREHIPTKSILAKPYPANLPVAEVCARCNEQHSLDEEYFIAFLSAVLTGSTDPNAQVLKAGTSIFARNKALRRRVERNKREYQTYGGQTNVVWNPELDRIHSVVIKNAKGHAFYENGEPMFDEPRAVAVFPLATASDEQLGSFFNGLDGLAVWPEVGSRWMQRMVGEPCFDNDGFYVLQPGVYRYRLEFEGGVTVKTVIHEYLATYVAW
ncbi:hypothetical protein [Ruegeria marisrubri]|nr:hypothetical protein [Ruegeria marisrubri]